MTIEKDTEENKNLYKGIVEHVETFKYLGINSRIESAIKLYLCNCNAFIKKKTKFTNFRSDLLLL